MKMKKWENKGHEFDEIGEILSKKNILVIYGKPELIKDMIEVITFLKSSFSEIEIIIVNKDSSYISVINDVCTILPQDMDSHILQNSVFVVCTCRYESEIEICKLLDEHNVNKKCIFNGNDFLRMGLSIWLVYNRDIAYFSSICLIPDTKCNLRCENCLNFTPYIKKHVKNSIENIKKDLDSLFNCVDYIYRFQISGGEPFLNDDLCNICSLVSCQYGDRIARLEVITNGTIVPNDNVCIMLHKLGVIVVVDDYRENVRQAKEQFDNVLNKLREFDINFIVGSNDKWFKIYPPKYTNRFTEEQLKKKYLNCNCEWVTLSKGSIVSCNYMEFAAKAGVTEKDEECYLKLESCINKKEVVEFRLGYNNKGYGEFCRLCNGLFEENRRYPVAKQV